MIIIINWATKDNPKVSEGKVISFTPNREKLNKAEKIYATRTYMIVAIRETIYFEKYTSVLEYPLAYIVLIVFPAWSAQTNIETNIADKSVKFELFIAVWINDKHIDPVGISPIETAKMYVDKIFIVTKKAASDPQI